MKRFFCTKCQEHKRVRRLPDNVVGSPGSLIGECRYHKFAPGMSHRRFIRKDFKAKTNAFKLVKKLAPPAEPAPAKGKRKAS